MHVALSGCGEQRREQLVFSMAPVLHSSMQRWRRAGDGRPMQRGASLTTTEHVDPAALPVAESLEDEEDPDDVRLNLL